VKSEQSDLADFAGSCAKAMETMYSDKAFQVRVQAMTASS
jgi:hypothetical protein